MSAWADFYAGRDCDSYYDYARRRYAPFIAAVANHCIDGDLLIEHGAGLGMMTKAVLSSKNTMGLGAEVRGSIICDPDPEMLFKAASRCNTSVPILCRADELPPPVCRAVVISHGVLEHFDVDYIREVIRANNFARWQFHYVPGPYASPSFGDERLEQPEWWQDTFGPDLIQTFNAGLDIVLGFKRGAHGT